MPNQLELGLKSITCLLLATIQYNLACHTVTHITEATSSTTQSVTHGPSLMAVHGAPSSCSRRISFSATTVSVKRLMPLYTVAYVPCSTSIQADIHITTLERVRCQSGARLTKQQSTQLYTHSASQSTLTTLTPLNWKLAHQLLLPRVMLTLILVSLGIYLFLRATAGTAIARLSHRNSVCPSVRPSVRHTGGSGKNGAS